MEAGLGGAGLRLRTRDLGQPDRDLTPEVGSSTAAAGGGRRQAAGGICYQVALFSVLCLDLRVSLLRRAEQSG